MKVGALVERLDSPRPAVVKPVRPRKSKKPEVDLPEEERSIGSESCKKTSKRFSRKSNALELLIMPEWLARWVERNFFPLDRDRGDQDA